MSSGLLAGLVFIVVTGGIVGVYMMFAGRSQTALQRTVESRLQEAAGFTKPSDAEEDSLVRVQSTGPMPNLDRVARRAIKGSALETWLEQSGTGMTPGSYFLISLLLAVAAAAAALTFVHHFWAMPLGSSLIGNSMQCSPTISR